ncbi:hypothetical protein BH10ACI1_BH10ACI1_18960 [soil metagenome]
MNLKSRVQKLEKKTFKKWEQDYSELLKRLTDEQLQTLYDLIKEGKSREAESFIKQVKLSWQDDF